jgi:hypothetical protein
MPRVLSALVALLLIALPSAAIAQSPQTNAPPGNSAIDEYLETVPGATGNQRPRSGGDPSDATLTPAQRAKLERLGPDGKALADAVDATAPAPAAPAGGPKSAGNAAEPSTSQGRSPLSEVVDAATGQDGGGGMGIVLPAILLATLLGVIALAVARRRSVS